MRVGGQRIASHALSPPPSFIARLRSLLSAGDSAARKGSHQQKTCLFLLFSLPFCLIGVFFLNEKKNLLTEHNCIPPKSNRSPENTPGRAGRAAARCPQPRKGRLAGRAARTWARMEAGGHRAGVPLPLPRLRKGRVGPESFSGQRPQIDEVFFLAI